MSKKELSDLKEKIELYQHRPFFKSLDNSISTIPYLSELKDCAAAIAQVANNTKLEYAWYCLSQDMDVERSINEIYNYVNDADRAFYISNEFRKIVLSVSLISSSIIAYIMGNVVREQRNCTHEEVIISNALVTMSDYDLENFIYLISECTDKLAGREVIEISKCKKEQSSCYYTLQLCTSNGLFKTESDIMGEDMDDPEDLAHAGALYGGLYYVKTPYCASLKKYIDKVKQLLQYGGSQNPGR